MRASLAGYVSGMQERLPERRTGSYAVGQRVAIWNPKLAKGNYPSKEQVIHSKSWQVSGTHIS